MPGPSGPSGHPNLRLNELHHSTRRTASVTGPVVNPLQAPMFASPQDVIIDGHNTFTNAGNNVYHIHPTLNVSLPSDSCLPAPLPVLPGSFPSTPALSTRSTSSPSNFKFPLLRHTETPEHDSEIYARLLLPKKLGWPLWVPRPHPSLPPAYRREGVSIGDVGVITANGEWEYLWNIRWEAEDERNRDRVPMGFRPVTGIEISVDERAWKIGARIINGSIQELEAQVGPPTLSFCFSCTPSEGAIIVLPAGGSRHTLLSRTDFKDYAGVNAESWYKHVNTPRRLGGLGREVTHGSLYLVTEVDKTRSWGIGSFAGVSGDGSFRMNFSAKPQLAGAEEETQGQNESEGSQCAYEWTASGLATTNHGPILPEPEFSHLENQCIFIRGFHIKIQEPPQDPLSRPGEVTSTTIGSSPESLPSPNNNIPSTSSGSERQNVGGFWGYFGAGSWFRKAGTGGNSLEVKGRGIIAPEFPTLSQALHPSNIINAYLLSRYPSARVAVTHDDVWIDVLEDDATQLPSPKELIERVEQKYEGINKEGVVTFVPRGSTRAVQREHSTGNAEITHEEIPRIHLHPATSSVSLEHSITQDVYQAFRAAPEDDVLCPIPSEIPAQGHPQPEETATQTERRAPRRGKAQPISTLVGKLKRAYDKHEEKNTTKILLLGQSDSGKSTVLKMLRMGYAEDDWKRERESWRAVIHLNIVQSIVTILKIVEDELNSSNEDGNSIDDTQSEMTVVGIDFKIAPISNQIPSASETSEDNLGELVNHETMTRAISPSQTLVGLGLTGWHRLLVTRLTPLRRLETELRRHLGIGTEPETSLRGSETTMVASPFDNPADYPTMRQTQTVQSQAVIGLPHEALTNAAADSSERMDTVGLGWRNSTTSAFSMESATSILICCKEDMQALWGDQSVQSALQRRNMYLDESGGFFLDDLDRIADRDYVLSNNDILRAKLPTVSVQKYDIRFRHDSPGTFDYECRIFDVGGSRTSRVAWLPYLADLTTIIFLLPISEFDQRLEEDPRVGRLQDSFNLWTSICASKLLVNARLILLLNKCDLLDKKLKRGVKVATFIRNYRDQNEVEPVVDYFKRHFVNICNKHSHKRRDIYVHRTTLTNIKTTEALVKSVCDSILRRSLIVDLRLV